MIKTKPAEIISIVNTDINVEFDEPVDYVEPPKVLPKSPSPPPEENTIVQPNTSRHWNIFKKSNSNKFVAFSGKGHRLGNA